MRPEPGSVSMVARDGKSQTLPPPPSKKESRSPTSSDTPISCYDGSITYTQLISYNGTFHPNTRQSGLLPPPKHAFSILASPRTDSDSETRPAAWSEQEDQFSIASGASLRSSTTCPDEKHPHHQQQQQKDENSSDFVGIGAWIYKREREVPATGFDQVDGDIA